MKRTKKFSIFLSRCITGSLPESPFLYSIHRNFPTSEREHSMAIEHVNGKNKGKIMLYALSTCGWCAKTKELLKELGVAFDFEYVDLLEGEELDETMNALERANPHGSFPTLVIDGSRSIIGFREQEIREAFGQ